MIYFDISRHIQEFTSESIDPPNKTINHTSCSSLDEFYDLVYGRRKTNKIDFIGTFKTNTSETEKDEI